MSKRRQKNRPSRDWIEEAYMQLGDDGDRTASVVRRRYVEVHLDGHGAPLALSAAEAVQLGRALIKAGRAI